MRSGNGAARKILIAWDGSRAAAAAFPVARLLGLQLGAELEVLHVAAAGESDEIRAAVREVGLDGLEERQLRVAAGLPSETILRAAADPAVRFLVLTTHSGGLEPGHRLGDVAERVVAGMTAPLVLVRPEAPVVQRELKRLLLPLDGTPKTAAALRPAFELAQRLGASIDLLHVAAPSGAPQERGSIGMPRYVDQAQHEWSQWSGEIVERLATCAAGCPPEVPVRTFLAHGEIGAEIERVAVEHQADALVLVRRSHLEAGRARVLRAVLPRTPCPIFVWSGPATEA